MSKSELEKRLKNREPAYLYASIYKANNKQFLGLLADLSETGFKLVSEKEIGSNTEYKLAIKNPHSAPPDVYAEFVANSVWAGGKDGIYETGFQFVSATKAANGLFVKFRKDFEATTIAINKLDDDDNFDIEAS